MTQSRQAGRSRDSLAAAALAEFAQFGFSGARTDRIARRAGVNKQLLHYYFGSKRGIYAASLGAAERHLLAEVATSAAEPPTATSVRSRLRTVFAAVLAEPEVVRLIVRGVGEGGEAAESATRVVQRLGGAIAGVIGAGQGIGLFRDDADPQLTARQAVALLFGYVALEPTVSAEGSGARSLTAWLEGAGDLLLRSLSW
jgi:AcrR family transcriptional regulator